MKKLVIIDGHSILYRAYHAIPRLTNKDGKPVNAVFGFVSMLLKTIQETHPDYCAIVFDRPGKTFRNELFENYQAHRKRPDDDFIAQIGMIQQLLEHMGFPVLGVDGYEADDVIGTLSKKASEMPNKRIEIIIVTSDRDQLQLVNDRVKLLMPAKSLGLTKRYGKKETIDRMGVSPRYVSDLKGLAGDPSDNIPGIAGIGPKTAASLINQFGSLEDIYDNLAAIEKKSVREKLEQNRDIAFLSKKLATIVTKVPITLNLKKAVIPDLVQPDTVFLLNNFGFTSLVKRLTKLSIQPPKQQPRPKTQKEQKKQEEQMGLF